MDHTRKASYVDSFEHAFDVKGRITVPSEWRDEGYESQLFVFPSKEGCLKVYPNSWLADQQTRMAGLALNDEKRRKVEALAAIAQKAVWDDQGRMKVGDKHRAHAALTKEAVLVGRLDHFEIWTPERYAAAKPEAMTLEEIGL